jgi:hypothetical protein
MSSLNTGALAKAAAASIAIYLVVYACNWGVNMAMGYSPGVVPQPGTDAYNSVLSIGLLLGCIGFLMYLAYGALYGVFARRDGTPVDVGQYALGGGLTGAIVAIVGAVIGGIVSVASGAMAAATAAQDLPPEAAGFMGGAIIVGLVVGLCVALVLGGGLAAAGGALYAALTRNRNPQPVPPAF